MKDSIKDSFEQNISYYNKIAEAYDNILADDPGNAIIRQQVAEYFSAAVKEGTVLDFGGGTGQDLPWLKKNKYNVIFCEPSHSMRAKAIETGKAEFQHQKIIFLDDISSNFVNWDAALPFPQKVDAVLCNFAVINCIADISKLFRSLALVTAPGANLLILALDSSFKSLVRIVGFRKAVVTLLVGQTINFDISFNGNKQHVYIHRTSRISKAAKSFKLVSADKIGSRYTLLHMKKNELVQ